MSSGESGEILRPVVGLAALAVFHGAPYGFVASCVDDIAEVTGHRSLYAFAQGLREIQNERDGSSGN